MSTARQSFFFDVIRSPQVLNTLQILLDLNVIRRFYHIDGNKFRVLPSWSAKNPTFARIKVFRRVVNPLTIQYSALTTMQHTLKSSYLILNTPYGLLTHREAMKRKTGGHLIFLVY
jgi:ribosomal protein S8